MRFSKNNNLYSLNKIFPLQKIPNFYVKLHTISRILLFHTCDWCRRRNLSEFGIEILSLSRTRRCLEQGLLLWITSRVSKKTIFDCGPSNLLLLTTHVTVKPRGFKAKRAEFVASFLVLLHSLLFLLLRPSSLF